MNGTLVNHKTIIVTGGTGTIGAEIVRHLLGTHASQIRIYSRDEHKQLELQQELPKDGRLRFLLGDIRDKERMDFAFHGVDICFHAAALKHVPFCEYNPFEAIKTNIVGTQNVIDLALKHNIEKVIAISTDKAVNPTSVLGTSKLMMEKLITAANQLIGDKRTKFATVRFGNVLSSRGSVMPIWINQIEKGGPLTITDKRATRFFMEVPEAVDLVFKAAEIMRGGEIFVLKMRRKFKIVDFANDVLERHAAGKKIAVKFIGLRPGEKLHEELVTEDEASHAIETKDMLIILPQHYAEGEEPHLRNYRGAKRMKAKAYSSDQ